MKDHIGNNKLVSRVAYYRVMRVVYEYVITR